MMKDITLGQYFPGETVVHKLDPRTKLILVLVFIVALFSAVSWVSYALMFAITAACIAVSKIRPKTLLRGAQAADFYHPAHGNPERVLHAGHTDL